MSSLRALKRKSFLKQKNNKGNLSISWPNISDSSEFSLKRSKSESDIRNLDPPKKDLKLHAKSELFLQSVYKSNKFTTSTPDNTLNRELTHDTNDYNIMQSSTFSVITDSEQIKIPIIGYEVMVIPSYFAIYNDCNNNFYFSGRTLSIYGISLLSSLIDAK